MLFASISIVEYGNLRCAAPATGSQAGKPHASNGRIGPGVSEDGDGSLPEKGGVGDSGRAPEGCPARQGLLRPPQSF